MLLNALERFLPPTPQRIPTSPGDQFCQIWLAVAMRCHFKKNAADRRDMLEHLYSNPVPVEYDPGYLQRWHLDKWEISCGLITIIEGDVLDVSGNITPIT